MNRRIVFSALALGAFFLALSACSQGPSTVALDESDAGKSVALKVGDELKITLEGNPSTGYQWEALPAEGAVLETVGEPEFQAESEQLGAPGRVTLTLEAVAAGQQTLQLVYHRPWESEAEPLETFEVTVSVAGK